MSEGWFCKIGDNKVGPLSVQQLKAIVARGQLRAEHLVRRGDAGPWVPAGRVKGLFPEKPAAGAAAKPAPAKTAAKPTQLPAARAAPQPPASELPPELSLGSGGHHKHHVAMNVDRLDIDAEPVMVSTRKTKGLAGLKKDEQQKLTFILLGIIGGGLLLALVLFIWAASQGYFSSSHKEEAKKDDAKTEETEPGKKAKTEAKPAEKDDDQWTKYPDHVFRKNIEVRPEKPVRGDPPEGSEVDASEHPTVLVLPFKLVMKLGAKKEDEVDFAGWDESDRKNVTLRDDTKAKYDLLAVIIEPKEQKVIAPGKPVTAKFIFAPPASKAKYLRLEMPGSAIGEQGMLKFQIPCAKITASRETGQKKAPAEDTEDNKTKAKSKAKGKLKAQPAETEEDSAEAPAIKPKAKKKNPPAETTTDDDGTPKTKKLATPKKTETAVDDAPSIDLPSWAKKPVKTAPKQGLDMGDDK